MNDNVNGTPIAIFDIPLEQQARQVVANAIMNPSTTAIAILGEAVAFALHFGSDAEKDFARAADIAIKARMEFLRKQHDELKQLKKRL
jgi:hypothetical protein